MALVRKRIPRRLSVNLHDHFKSNWLSCRELRWWNSKPENEKSMWPKWEIHVPNWVPNWGLTLWQWLLFEWWIKILFAIRNYQFLCSTTQICAQHGVLNENFLQKVAAKFNLTVFRGSFSRLTFWVRRRTCLVSAVVGMYIAKAAVGMPVAFTGINSRDPRSDPATS